MKLRILLMLVIVACLATLLHADSIKPSQGFDPGAIRASGKGPHANWIDFVTGAEAPTWAEGRVFWDKDNHCIGVYPEVSGPIMQVGQELWVRVKNEEVSTLTNGTVVYLSPPNTGSDPVAKLADASIATMSPVIGIVTHDIAPDTSGYVTCNGLVRGLNTSGIPEGSKIYLSETPGSYTATLPAAPASSIIVGYCLKEHETAGLLFVRVWLNGSIENAVFHNDVYFVATDSVRNNLDVYSKAETSALIPNNASFTLAGLSEKSYSSLTGKPSFGTMASETATNYVATSTLTAHENDTSTHGVAQVAGIADVSAALSAANASDTLNLRLDGSRAMTGSLKFSGNYGILQSTSDGSDSDEVNIGGGGAFSASRGAYLRLVGNESTSTGQAQYYAGDVTGGHHIFYTGVGTERVRITDGGKVGIGVTDPYNALEVKSTISLRNADNRTIRALHGSAFGYSGMYKTIVVGNTSGNETVCIGYDPINSTSLQFTGNGSEIFLRNGARIKTPNSADNNFYLYMKLVDDHVLIGTTTDDGTNKLQVNGSVAISSFMQLASPTAIPTAAAGRIYFNGTEAKFKKCTDGSNWIDM